MQPLPKGNAELMCLAETVDSCHSPGGQATTATLFLYSCAHFQSLFSWVLLTRSTLVTLPHHHWYCGSTHFLFFCHATHCDCLYPSWGNESCWLDLLYTAKVCILWGRASWSFSQILTSQEFHAWETRDFCLWIWAFCCSLRKSSFSDSFINISIASYLMNMLHSSAAIAIFPPQKMPGFNWEQLSCH